MTKEQEEMLERILDGTDPVCIHALGQGLVNSLCDIIRTLDTRIVDLEDCESQLMDMRSIS